MTNYKRFISYLYYYEVGQRKGNIGFARVESSDELCKVTVHCALKNIPQRVFKVFLLRRQTSQIMSEEVGTAELKDGALDVKLSYNQGIILPGEFEFKDCIGIALMYSRDHYIGAKWDDSSITYHEAGLIEQAVHNAKERSEISKPIEQPGTGPITQQPEKKREIKGEEKPKTTIYIVPPEEISVIDVESRKIESKPVQEKEQESQRTIETELEPECPSITEKKNEEIDEKTVRKEEVSGELADESVLEDEVKVATEIDQAAEEVIKAAGGSAAAAVNMNQWIDHPSARAILNRFVRMYPFDDGEIAECVRLEPKDIGLLPMTCWPLGNNSFLLHSYCNFRHLLFAKKLTREGCQYYLMVPGTLNQRERQLAKMFGFEDFKCSRRRCMRDGEFGYWYVEIVFN